jgi:hypothetical protein
MRRKLAVASWVLAVAFLACRSVSPSVVPAPDMVPPPETSDVLANRYGVLGVNLLKNAAFEERLLDWSVPNGAYWEAGGGMEGSGALVLQSSKPSGDPRPIREIQVSQCVALNEGTRFELSARFQRDKAPEKKYANRANVVWYESPDCSKGGQFGSFIEPADVDGWQTVSRGNLMPALGAHSAQIRIVQQGRYTNGGRAFWDDVSFHASEIFESSDPNDLPPALATAAWELGVSHVANGDFARDLVGWHSGSRAQWSSDGGEAPGSARITVRSEKSSLGTHGLFQCVDLGANARFELSARVRRDPASTQDGGGRLRLTWYENPGCSGRARAEPNWADPKKSEGWQRLRASSLVPRLGSRSAKIELIQSVAGAGEFSMFWDDVRLEAVE